MKVKLEVDIGYYWDYLSIIAVKYDKFGDSNVLDNLMSCSNNLRTQIGDKKFAEIYKSKEYMELYETNFKLFDYVDMVKLGQVTGKQVDDMVYVRWEKKKALQEKFFPESQYGEKKYGY